MKNLIVKWLGLETLIKADKERLAVKEVLTIESNIWEQLKYAGLSAQEVKKILKMVRESTSLGDQFAEYKRVTYLHKLWREDVYNHFIGRNEKTN